MVMGLNIFFVIYLFIIIIIIFNKFKYHSSMMHRMIKKNYKTQVNSNFSEKKGKIVNCRSVQTADLKFLDLG